MLQGPLVKYFFTKGVVEIDKYLKHMAFPLDPLTHLSDKDPKATWKDYLIKPAIMLAVFVVIGYITMWMSINFVKQDKFAEYVQHQIQNDTKQDGDAKQRFEITQGKLETIITQQVSYSEQLKAYNQVMLGIQKQVDNLDERLKYLERTSHNSLSN